MPDPRPDYGDPSLPPAGEGGDDGLLLFGGAFNPPHRSHHRILTAALQALPVTGALVLPAGRHPLKDTAGLAADAARLELCQLAFDDLPGVTISDLDLRAGGPAYTIDTVAQVQADHPGRRLFWLFGSDNLRILDQWHDHHALLRCATLVTFPRLGYPVERADLAALDLTEAEVDALLAHVLDVDADDINATEIRAALARDEAPPSLDPRVLGRIRQLGLYRD